jgi:hypothetical protein
MSVYCECCVLLGRGVCDWPIPRPEKFYRPCVYLIVRDLETSTMRRPEARVGLLRHKKLSISNSCTADVTSKLAMSGCRRFCLDTCSYRLAVPTAC